MKTIYTSVPNLELAAKRVFESAVSFTEDLEVIDTLISLYPGQIEFKRTPDGVITVYGNGIAVRSELASHYIASSNNLAIIRYKKMRSTRVLSYSNVLELK